MAPGQVRLADLVGRIRAEFPALEFDRATLNDNGEDHAVVVLDDGWVFRFPRGDQAASYAAGERRLLARLNPASEIATPRYDHVSTAGDFGGYRMIAGRELRPKVFAALPGDIQERVLDEMGGFLVVLHALPPELITGPDGTEARLVDRRGLRPEIQEAPRGPGGGAVARPAGGGRPVFDALPEAVDTADRVLIHGDFTDAHILLAPGGDRLAGVIDFTDAMRGDPAADFTYLWAYGDGAPARAARRYGAGADIDAMLTRSRWWYARYLIDQIWAALRGSDPGDVAALAERLAPVLEALKP